MYTKKASIFGFADVTRTLKPRSLDILVELDANSCWMSFLVLSAVRTACSAATPANRLLLFHSPPRVRMAQRSDKI